MWKTILSEVRFVHVNTSAVLKASGVIFMCLQLLLHAVLVISEALLQNSYTTITNNRVSKLKETINLLGLTKEQYVF